MSLCDECQCHFHLQCHFKYHFQLLLSIVIVIVTRIVNDTFSISRTYIIIISDTSDYHLQCHCLIFTSNIYCNCHVMFPKGKWQSFKRNVFELRVNAFKKRVLCINTNSKDFCISIIFNRALQCEKCFNYACLVVI